MEPDCDVADEAAHLEAIARATEHSLEARLASRRAYVTWLRGRARDAQARAVEAGIEAEVLTQPPAGARDVSGRRALEAERRAYLKTLGCVPMPERPLPWPSPLEPVLTLDQALGGAEPAGGTVLVEHPTARELARLASAPWLSALRGLEILGGELSPAAIADLFAGARFPALESLKISRSDLDDHGVAALASAPSLARVSVLDLRRNRLQAEAGLALADATHLASLTWLVVSGNWITGEGLAAILASPRLPSLAVLDASECYLGTRDGIALFRARIPRHVRWVDGSVADLHPDVRLALARRHGARLCL